MFSVYITSEQTSFMNVGTLVGLFLHLTALPGVVVGFDGVASLW